MPHKNKAPKLRPFTPDLYIDSIRTKYKLEYDLVLVQIRDARDEPDLIARLYKRERKLNQRTKDFIKEHLQYYAQKRAYHMAKIEECEGLLHK